ncbi:MULTISPECIES: hypothetical protein [Bacillus cereus group]|nr:hypothetical protein [Bacillus cereus]KAA6457018.1 hypothetical protein DX930_30150 [Bacillus cereus]KAB2418918.1 hypothetical protein F8169_00365 [Bacillus cereus]KAB2439248.1 hypothetical protein F8166_00295 [Bacillus cereus]
MNFKNVSLFEKEMKELYGDYVDINACLEEVENEINMQGMGEVNQTTQERIDMYNGKSKYSVVNFYLTLDCVLDEDGEIENTDFIIDFAM